MIFKSHRERDIVASILLPYLEQRKLLANIIRSRYSKKIDATISLRQSPLNTIEKFIRYLKLIVLN